jgi:hypothetical protein
MTARAVTRVAPVAAAVPAVRARTAEMLTEWSVDAEAVAAVELVTSKSVTNPVKQVERIPGRIRRSGRLGADPRESSPGSARA